MFGILSFSSIQSLVPKYVQKEKCTATRLGKLHFP